MKHRRRFIFFEAVLLALILALTGTRSLLRADTSSCSGANVTIPFTDILNSQSAGFFCAIAQAFFTGLTSGTSATTFSPDATVTRAQMAAFITRTMDQSLKRGSRRAALGQYWTPQDGDSVGLTTVGTNPGGVQSDGADLWVANFGGPSVSRVRASSGQVLQTYTANLTGPVDTLIARGKVYVLGSTKLCEIDPSLPPSATNPSLVASGLVSPSGSVAAYLAFDGASIWVTDSGDNSLKKLDAHGSVILTVPLGAAGLGQPVFDGTNIWVPAQGGNKLVVVRAATGAILTTLSGNGLNAPFAAAFDGERILVTNASGNSVSLWKAADLSPLGSFSMGASSSPRGACSDGLNFWIVLSGPDKLARF